jgi:hypothetical protein
LLDEVTAQPHFILNILFTFTVTHRTPFSATLCKVSSLNLRKSLFDFITSINSQPVASAENFPVRRNRRDDDTNGVLADRWMDDLKAHRKGKV